MKKTKLCKHIKRTMAILLSLAMMWHAGSVLCVSASAECIEKNQEKREPGTRRRSGTPCPGGRRNKGKREPGTQEKIRNPLIWRKKK